MSYTWSSATQHRTQAEELNTYFIPDDKELQQKGYRSGYSKRSTDLVDRTGINVSEQTDASKWQNCKSE